MFKKYKGKNPPELKYRKKTVEVPKVKCELFFVGRNGETENYVESYTGVWVFNGNRPETPDEIIEYRLLSYGYREGCQPPLMLKNNNRSMNMEYYTLAKVVIKDVKQVEIEIEEPYYEEE